MMKMNRFLSMMATSLAALAFTACSSDDALTGSQNAQTPAAQTYTMTVTAQKGGEGTRALSLDGNMLNATWKEGEQVAVYNSSNVQIGTLTAQGNGITTTLKGDLTVLPAVSDKLTLKFLSGDYNSQDGTVTGTDKSIDRVCDYSTATVTVSDVIGTKVSTTDATFAKQQAVIKFTLQNIDGTALPSNPTAFTMTDGTNTVTLTDIPAATYTANGDGVLYVAFPASGSSADIKLTAMVGEDEYTYEKASVTFNNSEYYDVTVKMEEVVPEGVISGKFSVSATKKVYFSKGNLQLTAADTWQFATSQSGYFGNSQSDNHRDLFGWGTGNNPNQTSTEETDYKTFTDWGNNTALQSQLGTGWRTLSKDEWEYLFGANSYSKRTTTSGILFAKATVNGISGVILLPDDWSSGYYTLASTNTTGAAYTTNTITASDWTSKLESKGCVFLPAAGYRFGTEAYRAGTDGYYWSSSLFPSTWLSAYFVNFDSSSLIPASDRYGCTCNNGNSVRLVRDVE